VNHKKRIPDIDSLVVAADRPLVGVLVEEDGRQIVRYFAGDRSAASPSGSEESLQAALAVIGAWSDLDWDDFSLELDRIRHESKPTPPIDLDE
jgi:hypothetical protein